MTNPQYPGSPQQPGQPVPPQGAAYPGQPVPPQGAGYPGQPVPPPGIPGQGPAKSKKGLIIGIVAALVVVAGAVTAILLFTGGDKGGDSPEGTAEAFVTALKDGDVGAMKGLMCASGQEGASDALSMLKELEGPHADQIKAMMKTAKFEFSDFKVSGDSATANLKVSALGQESPASPVKFTKENGKWVVCG